MCIASLENLHYSNSLLSEVPARSITNYQLPTPAIYFILLRKAIYHKLNFYIWIKKMSAIALYSNSEVLGRSHSIGIYAGMENPT
ncbi:MAG: hypothetical protein HC849_00250 [Oscillatoriales cyanobacterium RU_3_3]|nr:hypothetical protein [Microcoleus sp. SU_5_6]NJL67062.1 hypothetical protein [Microcoleus sp. SM1_3_4]NJM58971.1 hypothetical protein [Oscillatoriales cyanobacterium RU_3_3]